MSQPSFPTNQTFKPRKDFGLNDTMNVYGCIQSSFKISDDGSESSNITALVMLFCS
jgi:hypothetical protein